MKDLYNTHYSKITPAMLKRGYDQVKGWGGKIAIYWDGKHYFYHDNIVGLFYLNRPLYPTYVMDGRYSLYDNIAETCYRHFLTAEEKEGIKRWLEKNK